MPLEGGPYEANLSASMLIFSFPIQFPQEMIMEKESIGVKLLSVSTHIYIL